MVERLINHTEKVICPLNGNLTGLCLFTIFYSVFLTVFKPSERPVSWPVMWEAQLDAVAHNVWHQIKWIDTSIFRKVCVMSRLSLQLWTSCFVKGENLCRWPISGSGLKNGVLSHVCFCQHRFAYMSRDTCPTFCRTSVPHSFDVTICTCTCICIIPVSYIRNTTSKFLRSCLSALTIVWRNEDETGWFYLFNIKTLWQTVKTLVATSIY